MKMVGILIVLILTRKYIPFIEKVRMGYFLVNMEIQVYNTLLDERSHLIGPFQKGMWRKKQIKILKLHLVYKTNVMNLDWKVCSIKIIK
jgi:hypothetical protein